jgi:hypothetical protein
LLADAFPNLKGSQIIDILFDTADDLGSVGDDSTFGQGRLNIARAFQPIGTTTLAGTQVVVGDSTGGDLPPAAGDGGGSCPEGSVCTSGSKLGAVILDGYSRAYAIDLARSLRGAIADKPLHRALDGGNTVRSSAVSAGPFSVAMTVAERPRSSGEFDLQRLTIGPDDARKARLVAGSAIARLDRKTAIAFGLSESSKALERRLSGAEAGAFLIARDTSGDPGFAAKRGTSMAMRRDLGPVGLTMSSESGEVWQEVETTATGSPYRWTSLTLDRNFGKTWLSASLSKLDEKRTVLGGRLSDPLGGGGSNSLFLDVEARRELGHGLVASASARRGWTDFAGGAFQSAAYAFDLQKWGLFRGNDRLGLRIAQPLRIEQGGIGMMLPTAYSYETERATNSWSTLSFTPSGREIAAELSYSTAVASGWLSGNAFARRQPGHVESAAPDVGGAVRFTLGF